MKDSTDTAGDSFKLDKLVQQGHIDFLFSFIKVVVPSFKITPLFGKLSNIISFPP